MEVETVANEVQDIVQELELLLKKKEPENIWYDPTITLSHNCIWNMVLSARGGGKTFNCLEMCVKAWIKKKKRFIYLRRTDAELQQCKDHLMDAVQALGHFGDAEFKTLGNDIYMNDEVIGYCVALSKAYQMKSVAFPDVDIIIFDEFLIEDRNGRYLPNEPHKVMALMETVGRMRGCKIIMLANYVSRANIYFDYWGMFPRLGSTFTKHPTKPILIHMYENQGYKAKKAETPFAKLVEGTSYGGYLLNNDALADNYTFVEPVTGIGNYLFTFKWGGKSYGCMLRMEAGVIHFTHKIDPSCKRIYAFDINDHEPNVLLFQQLRKTADMQIIRGSVDQGRARFSNLSVKNAVLEILNYL